MSSDDFRLEIPDHQQMYADARKLPPVPGPTIDSVPAETVLEQATKRLTTQPKTRFYLPGGEKFAASVPANSFLNKEVLREAVRRAGRYHGDCPLPLAQLSPDRIQRLILGLAELLQAELLADRCCHFDQLDEELHAVQRCLRKGWQADAAHQEPCAYAGSEFDDQEEHEDDPSQLDR